MYILFSCVFITGPPWILLSRSLRRGCVSVVCIALCPALWDTKVRGTAPPSGMLTYSFRSHDGLEDGFKICHKGVVCGHLTFSSEWGRRWMDTCGKTLPSGWQLSWASEDRWDLARKKGKGQSWVGRRKPAGDQAGPSANQDWWEPASGRPGKRGHHVLPLTYGVGVYSRMLLGLKWELSAKASLVEHFFWKGIIKSRKENSTLEI